MYKPDVLVIGINSLPGAGKTTLIDRLCVELRDEFEISVISGVFNDSVNKPLQKPTLQRSLGQNPFGASEGMARVRNEINAIQSRYLTSVLRQRSVRHLLLVEGNSSSYAQWMREGLISDLIHIVDLDRPDKESYPTDEFLKKAGLLIINKLDKLELNNPDFIDYCLQIQMKRGYLPKVFSSMHTGFGLDLIVTYLQQKIVMRRIFRKRIRDK